MATWVLIAFFKAGYSGGVLSQEFSNRENCEVAVSAIVAEDYQLFAICVEK